MRTRGATYRKELAQINWNYSITAPIPRYRFLHFRLILPDGWSRSPFELFRSRRSSEEFELATVRTVLESGTLAGRAPPSCKTRKNRTKRSLLAFQYISDGVVVGRFFVSDICTRRNDSRERVERASHSTFRPARGRIFLQQNVFVGGKRWKASGFDNWIFQISAIGEAFGSQTDGLCWLASPSTVPEIEAHRGRAIVREV